MSDLVRFGVSLEADLARAFDTYVKQKRYPSRSEAIRDLIRDALSRAVCADHAAPAVASLTLLYSHRSRQLADRLIRAQHQHHHTVLSTLHVHLDEERCLEVLVLKGQVGDLQHLADQLIATKGVTHGQLVAVALDSVPPGILRNHIGHHH